MAMAYQKESPFEIALVPSVSPFMDYSYYILDKTAPYPSIEYTQLKSSKSFYWGLGLQAHLWNDWQVTLNISETYLGGGIKPNSKYKDIIYRLGGWFESGKSTNQFSLNVEKGLYQSPTFQLKDFNLSFKNNVLIGMGMNWFSYYDTVGERKSYANSHPFNFIKISDVINTYTATVSIGWTHQLFINYRQSLKLGVLYSYGFQPMQSIYYNVNYILVDNISEEFNVFAGQHRLLFYAAYPIVLYRNKAQRDFVGKKRRTRKK